MTRRDSVHPLFRFFQWNDMHVQEPGLVSDDAHTAYPFANEKAMWAADCAAGMHGFSRPDFIASAGDLVNGDFTPLRRMILDKLESPLMPCTGNHENEGRVEAPSVYPAYDACFGAGFHNFAYTFAGFAFIVVDIAAGNCVEPAVVRARNGFVARALERFGSMPMFIITHVPLIPMRSVESLEAGVMMTWKVFDEGVLKLIEARADRVVAALSGHLHFTSIREQNGITHIMPAGTTALPGDFASFEVYTDRIEVTMHAAPAEFHDIRGDIHRNHPPGRGTTDAQHPTHDAYIRGNADERRRTIQLPPSKRPYSDAPRRLEVFQNL